jgi:hypothetical protein
MVVVGLVLVLVLLMMRLAATERRAAEGHNHTHGHDRYEDAAYNGHDVPLVQDGPLETVRGSFQGRCNGPI